MKWRTTIVAPPVIQELREAAPLTVIDKHDIERRHDEAEAIAEVNATLPGPNITDLAPRRERKRSRWPWVLAGVGLALGLWMLFVTHAAPVAMGLGGFAPSLYASPPSPGVCVWGDGSVSAGTCIFDDEFSGSSLDTTQWFANNDWAGPMNLGTDGSGNPPELTCITSNNVTVSGGQLHLAFTVNARLSCPQTWPKSSPGTPKAYYNTNWGTPYPPGQATSYDGAVVDMKCLQYTYGRTSIRAKLAAGTGPGPDATLWGVNCQDSTTGGTIGNYLSGLFNHDGSCQFPTTPGSQEFDLFNYNHGVGATTSLNFTSYVDNSVGSPPLVGTYALISYYGHAWGNLGAPFTAFMGPAISDPSAGFHIYESDWQPPAVPGGAGVMSYYVDGNLQAVDRATWISKDPVYLMLWNIDTTAVTAITIGTGQIMDVDWVRVWCPGNYCVVNRAATGC